MMAFLWVDETDEKMAVCWVSMMVAMMAVQMAQRMVAARVG